MRKHALLFLALTPLFALASCADEGEKPAESSSSGLVHGKNTVETVLGSFGKNIRVNNSFQLIDSDKPVSVMTDYVEEGCLQTFRNIPNVPEKSGFVSKDGKTNAFTVTKNAETKKDEFVLGDELLKGGASVASFRDVYYDPSFIGEHVADYVGENIFIPKIAGATNGTFFLYETVEKDGQIVKDNTVILENLAKAMGVYDIAMSFKDAAGKPELDLSSADLYFSAEGDVFTINFYFSYKGGYDRFNVRSAISNIGKTKVAVIEEYLKPATPAQ